jgi:DNA-binding NtrC family response regulator
VASCAAAVETLTRLGERLERARALQMWAARSKDAAESRRLLYRAAACCHEAGADHELERLERAITLAGAGPAGLEPEAPPEPETAPALAGKSRALVKVRESVQRAARSQGPVLIEGPPGVGKSLIARTIHARSRRAAGPLVVVPGAALAAERALLDLVGDARTGIATTGLLAQAAGGTLVLEDIGALPPAAQIALARVLATGDYLCPGELEPRVADVRVIAVSTAPLEERVAQARFRADLLERLSAIAIVVPPLCERAPDILPLAHAFLKVYGGPDAPRIDQGAADRLIAHAWPGNARELELVIQGALIQTPAGARTLGAGAVEASISACTAEPGTPSPESAGTDAGTGDGAAEDGSSELRARLVEAERRELVSAIERAHGNKSRAARLLKVSRKTLYARLHRHGLALEDEAS